MFTGWHVPERMPRSKARGESREAKGRVEVKSSKSLMKGADPSRASVKPWSSKRRLRGKAVRAARVNKPDYRAMCPGCC